MEIVLRCAGAGRPWKGSDSAYSFSSLLFTANVIPDLLLAVGCVFVMSME